MFNFSLSVPVFLKHMWNYKQSSNLYLQGPQMSWNFVWESFIITHVCTIEVHVHVNPLIPETRTSKVHEPPHDKTNKMTCVPSEDSDQPGHPPSLIRVFTVRSIGSLKGPMFLHVDSKDSDQTGWMPRLIWVFTGCTGHFNGFVIMWLNYCLFKATTNTRLLLLLLLMGADSDKLSKENHDQS